RTYIPYKIPPQLSDWLAFGPQDGHIHDARFVYHGQVHVQPGVPGRRIELQARLSDGVVRYDRAWPQVTDLAAQVHVAGSVTRANVQGGQTMGIDLSGTRVAIVDNGLYADLDLQAAGDGDQVLDFVRGSPLQNNLNFITPGWQSAGRMRFDGELVVPLKEQPAPAVTTGRVATAPPLAVNLNLELAGVDLVMPEYRMQVASLEGTGRFRLPHHLTGRFVAEVFAQPARIAAASDNNWLWFDIDGKATPEDVYGLIEYTGQAPLTGDFAFKSRLNIAVGGGVTNLAMTSDLTGLEVGLPGEFGKSAEASAPLELDVQFLSDYQSLRWQYQTTNGWLHVGDGIEGGAIGINQPPPMTAREDQAILISGRMAQLDLGEWVGTDGESFALPVDWTLRNLAVEEFVVDELSFPQLALSGSQRGTDLAFQFAGAQLQGEVLVPAEGRLQIDLDYLALPAAATAAVQAGLPVDNGAAALAQAEDSVVAQDPLSVEVGRSLPAADVRVARLDLGEQPFGSWQFTLQPEEDRLVMAPFVAEVNGVHFHDSRIVWDLATNRSSFNGSMKLDDLEQTLPQWGYAASLQTTAATMGADAHWPGSPANLNLLELVGQLELNASDGRFLEVEGGQGGLRILSLINFSKIAKRISFDFSDVVGSGISFDTIEAQVELDAGTLRFVEPMLVDSSSGIFQVGGRVNLDTGQLDNEMIVTLPVSNSLPWYGVYLALANPLAGLGVLVGERVLRNPIKQFSSAKFEVSGTLDEPKVQFVSLWDRSMRDSAPGEDPAELNTPAGDPAGTVQDATLGNAQTLPLNAPGE
ncbi:MAG: AsmA-like C-terminal region-containing protein, partial [Pseudomonadota bacterium]